MYIYIQECLTRIFHPKIVLFHVTMKHSLTYVGRGVVIDIDWLDRKNLVQRSQKWRTRQLSYALLKKFT